MTVLQEPVQVETFGHFVVMRWEQSISAAGLSDGFSPPSESCSRPQAAQLAARSPGFYFGVFPVQLHGARVRPRVSQLGWITVPVR